MAHNAQAVFFKQVRKTFPDHFTWKNVLEVGSLDINGSVRPLFDYCNYVGFDLAVGPGVDYGIQGQDIQYPDNSFDVAISAECFEHNPYWAKTFKNMVRMTKPGGLVTFTCAGEGRPEHGTARSDIGSSPLTVASGWDYYRNLMIEDFQNESLLRDLNWQSFYNAGSQDLYFVGQKVDVVSHGNKWVGQTNLIEELPWNDINAEDF